jgi:putative aldouronate transport system permease protein
MADRAGNSTMKRTESERAPTVRRQRFSWKLVKRQRELILLTIPFLIYTFIFNYTPLFGWIMAFQNYSPVKGFLGSEWIGFEKFRFLFVGNREFLKVLRNTLCMSVINLSLSTFCAITFALLVNEIMHKTSKRIAQTISYLPHFLSWIVVCGIVKEVLSVENGIVNELLVFLHLIPEPVNWFTKPALFWWITALTNVWKETGWNSIIYLAAITAINPELCEAAAIDGAGKLGRIWHIILPGIRPTIVILLIMSIGGILNAGFEMQYLLSNSLLRDVSQTVDIYVLNYGISQNDFSLGTAAGMFKSVVSILLIFMANSLAKAVGEERLF